MLAQEPEDQDLEAIAENPEQGLRASEPLNLAAWRAEQSAEIETERAHPSRDRYGWDR